MKEKSGNIRGFSELSAEWLKEKKETLSPVSYQRYSGNLENHILPYVYKRTIINFTKEDVFMFTIFLKNCALSSKTVRNILYQLKLICTFGQERYELSNPFQNMELPVEKAENDLCFFSPGEIRQLEQYLTCRPDSGKLGILICLHTGLRLIEIAALRWENIDWKNNILHIENMTEKNPEGKGVYRIAPLEGSWKRNIPIYRKLREWLQPLKEDQGYILTGTAEFLNPRTYEYRCKAYYNEAFVRTLNFTALRDTFAINRLQAGCDMEYLAELLGYAHSVNVWNRYGGCREIKSRFPVYSEKTSSNCQAFFSCG